MLSEYINLVIRQKNAISKAVEYKNTTVWIPKKSIGFDISEGENINKDRKRRTITFKYIYL
jgi:hypothetical protein